MKKHPVIPDDHAQLGKAEHIAALVTGYINQTLNHTEGEELDRWIADQDDNMVLFEEMTDEKELQKELEMLEKADVAAALKKCKKKLGFNRKN
jgi:hypothetical protein